MFYAGGLSVALLTFGSLVNAGLSLKLWHPILLRALLG